MPDRKTQGLHDKLQKTVGGSFKSLLGKKGQTFFILEFKTATDNYEAGKSITFTSDYIEIGRSPKCALSFSPDNRYISRLHAAIQKEGDKYLLKHISQTNPTLVNGLMVEDQTYLKNGDEIQLSNKGPKIGFLAPQNNVAGSLPLSIRLQSFGREVLKPYKWAVAIISFILLVSIGTSSYFLTKQQGTIKILGSELDHIERLNSNLQKALEETRIITQEQEEAFKQGQKESQEQIDRLLSENVMLGKNNEQLSDRIGEIKDGIEKAKEEFLASQNNTPHILSKYNPDIYLIFCRKVEIANPKFKQLNEQLKNYQWTGTGFLLNDGRFYTARHVIEGWMYLNHSSKEEDFILNRIATLGEPVIAYFEAYSPTGAVFEFKNTDFSFDTSLDRMVEVPWEDGSSVYVTIPLKNNEIYWGTDWAMMKTNEKGVISVESDITQPIAQGTDIYVLGYSYGMVYNKNQENLEPLFSMCKTAQSGLNNGVIIISNRSFETGNSGGPAFIKINNELKAIGIVSSGIEGIGHLVPITSHSI